MDREIVDLTVIVPAHDSRVGVMSVAAADGEPNRTLSQPPRLALNTGEANTIIDDEVIPRVLPEGKEHQEARLMKGKDDGEGRSIANRLRVLHVVQNVNTVSDGIPCDRGRSSSAGRASDL